MIRAVLFLTVTFSFLWALDARVILRRIFWRSDLEPFLNKKAPEWARGIFALANLFLGLKANNETDSKTFNSLPPQFIAISNHQSLLDILINYALFNNRQVRFVAKSSLGHWFPGASQTLRYQRHALIERAGNARQTFEKISAFGRLCKKRGYCPVVFPEGTRSRDGSLGTFHPAGLRMILDQCELPIVVVAADGCWELATVRSFLGPGAKNIRMKILGVLPAPSGKEETKLTLEKAKSMIQAQLDEWRRPSSD